MTKYVGDLFEETNGRKTDFVFMGSQRVAAYDGDRLRWFITDHLGSTNLVLDETSGVKEKIAYTPWGEVASYDNFGNNAEVAWLYFTGKKTDDEVGLVYFGARFYNPKLGRFITADTIVQSPYNPQTLNRYTYCNNNPVNLVDPTGHKWKWKSVVAAVVGAVVGVAITIASGGTLTAAYGAFWGGVMAGALGGAAGGAVTGGMLGGTQGALQGAMMGAVFGGIAGGVGGSSWTPFAKDVFQNSALIGGGAYSIATGHADMFVGALIGGGIGYKMATGQNPSYWSATSKPVKSEITWDDICEAQIRQYDTEEASWRDMMRGAGGGGASSEINLGRGGFPPNRGFQDGSAPAMLRPGATVDRFGDARGSFLSPRGTPFAARSLPAEAATRPLTTYRVVAPVQVQAGTAAPAYGQPGGGIQYDLGGRSVQDLIKQGSLIEQ